MKFKQAIFVLAIFLMLAPVTAQSEKLDVYFVYSDLCPHCNNEKPVIEELEKKSSVKIHRIKSKTENSERIRELQQKHEVNASGVPQTYVGDVPFMGYNEEIDVLFYASQRKAYVGSEKQIRKAVEIQLNPPKNRIDRYDAIDISEESPEIKEFIRNRTVYATVNLTERGFLIAWWNQTRLTPGNNVPNLVSIVNSSTGEIVKTFEPEEPVKGVIVPNTPSRIWDFIAYLGVFIYLVLYLVYLKFKDKIKEKYELELEDEKWFAGFIILCILIAAMLVVTHPEEGIGYLPTFLSRLVPII